jgi:hypothetical protein
MEFSPRAQFAIKPDWEKDIVFRLSTGLYVQPPSYRELRDSSGTVLPNVKAQKSIHFVLSSDYSFKMWNRPFKLVSEAYYKILNDVNPYTAFWIYDNKEFKRFLQSPSWDPSTLVPAYGVREAAAIGMHHTRIPLRLYNFTLLPLTQDMKVDPNCRVYHLANNYVDTPYCFFATLLFDEAVCVDHTSFRHPNEVIQRKHARLLRRME